MKTPAVVWGRIPRVCPLAPPKHGYTASILQSGDAGQQTYNTIVKNGISSSSAGKVVQNSVAKAGSPANPVVIAVTPVQGSVTIVEMLTETESNTIPDEEPRIFSSTTAPPFSAAFTETSETRSQGQGFSAGLAAVKWSGSLKNQRSHCVDCHAHGNMSSTGRVEEATVGNLEVCMGVSPNPFDHFVGVATTATCNATSGPTEALSFLQVGVILAEDMQYMLPGHLKQQLGLTFGMMHILDKNVSTLYNGTELDQLAESRFSSGGFVGKAPTSTSTGWIYTSMSTALIRAEPYKSDKDTLIYMSYKPKTGRMNLIKLKLCASLPATVTNYTEICGPPVDYKAGMVLWTLMGRASGTRQFGKSCQFPLNGTVAAKVLVIRWLVNITQMGLDAGTESVTVNGQPFGTPTGMGINTSVVQIHGATTSLLIKVPNTYVSGYHTVSNRFTSRSLTVWANANPADPTQRTFFLDFAFVADLQLQQCKGWFSIRGTIEAAPLETRIIAVSTTSLAVVVGAIVGVIAGAGAVSFLSWKAVQMWKSRHPPSPPGPPEVPPNFDDEHCVPYSPDYEFAGWKVEC